MLDLYRLLAALSLLCFCAAPIVLAQAPQPNVVIILADDLGWNDVGYHGSEIHTPNLDTLAAAGVVLNQFHAQPTCTPTRTALMTGKSPQRLGIYRQFAKNSTQGLPVTERTLADFLKSAGYQTFLTGKWHLGHAKTAFHPNARGFDHFYGHVTGGIGYWDHVHGGGLDWQRNGETLRENGYSTHLLANEATQLIRHRDRTRPFLLYASFNAPHLPNEAPPDIIETYQHIDNPYRRLHAAMVTELDTAVGQIIQTLADTGDLDNTLIWFMSDNGGLNPSAGMDGFVTFAKTLDDWFEAPLPITFLEFIRINALEGGSDNSPMRNGKGSVYQGGVRVPAVVHWPKFLEPHVSEAMITVQDVLPTILRATDIDVSHDFDGKNRWSVLQKHSDEPPADYVTMGQQGAQAYYQWPWKLVEADDDYELYNLHADPLEQDDVAASNPDRVSSLTKLLQNLPRAESLHIPLYQVIWDPDFFGGEEDRPPWADVIL